LPNGWPFVPGLPLGALDGAADGAAETDADGTIVRPFLPRTALPRAALGFTISLTGSDGGS
jgi:hypothetical protein